jgi:hypothetical protein
MISLDDKLSNHLAPKKIVINLQISLIGQLLLVNRKQKTMKRTFGNMISNTFKKRKTTIDGPALDINETDLYISPRKEIPTSSDPFALVKLIITPRRKKTGKERKTPSTIESERKVQSEKKVTRRRTLFQKENMFSDNALKKTPSKDFFQLPDNIFQFGSSKKQNEEVVENPMSPMSATPTKRILFMDEEVQHPMSFDIFVHEARNLISSSVGFKDTSDPYVVVKIDGMQQKTNVKQATVNPKFNQQFTFFKDSNVEGSSLTLEIYDHDEVFDHESLGKVEISLAPAIQMCKMTNNQSDEFSNWYPVENGTGEILVSFRAREGVEMTFV